MTATATTEATVKVWGRTWTKAESDARVAELREGNELWGESDDRVTELNAHRDAWRAVREAARQAAERAKHYYGFTVRAAQPFYGSAPRTTHFVNAWDETFCGVETRTDHTYVDDSKHGRATCLTCRKAGDAWMAAGFPADGGSAAHRA